MLGYLARPDLASLKDEYRHKRPKRVRSQYIKSGGEWLEAGYNATSWCSEVSSESEQLVICKDSRVQKLEHIIRTGERREIPPGGTEQGPKFKVPRLGLKEAMIVTQYDTIALMALSPRVLRLGMF